jgi:hypothetical protein
VPRFGKDKNARNEELDRQAAEEVERLTRRGAGPGGGGMPGMPGMGGGPPRIGPPSPLEMMAAEVADRPPPSQRRAQAPRKPAPRPQQAFTAMPSGGVGSSFGPGGLNPGPRGAGVGAPPPSFGGGAYDDDFGGAVTGPPVYHAEPDEEEEMSITEMALMDHAARTGHNPEDLVMQYDASSAEEMRDRAMRQFYERQQSRGPAGGTTDPFAPAGQRRGPSGPGIRRRPEDPAAAGGALAQRLAARRRREEEQARPEPPPVVRPPRATVPSAASVAAKPAAERDVDEGALARVLARRRAALGVDSPAPAAPGRGSASLRAVPEPAIDDDDVDVDDEPLVEEAPKPRAAKKSPPVKKAAPAAKKAAPAAKKASAPAEKAPAAKKAAKKAPAKKAGATLAKAPAKKATTKKAAAKPAGKAKTVFCIECGEKNPAIAKFCFNCGTRLAAPEG